MATFIKGDAVANATSYELFEKSGDIYASLATNTEINFEVSAMNLAAGTHTLVVKAKATGYTDSEYSNSVDYTVEDGSTVLRTIPLPAILSAYTKASSSFGAMNNRVTAYGNIKAGDILEVVNPNETFSNELLVYEVQAKDAPTFGYTSITHSETYVKDLRTDYAPESYTFENDCRFLAVMLDRNNLSRDFSKYHNFCLYNLKREYMIGVATPIQAYYGTYNGANGTYDLTQKLRALAVLDLKVGDVVECATDDLRLNVIKLKDNSYEQVEVIVGSTTETSYKTTSWTSDADQRVIVLARSESAPNGTVTEDLNAVFKVTFNS